MNRLLQSFESVFTIAALVFFTRVLDFESLHRASEGKLESLVSVGENPIAPILSLMQHGIFLVVISLLVLRSRDTINTLARGKVIWVLIVLVLLSFFWSNIPDISFRGAFGFLETCVFGLYFASRYNLKEQLRLIAWALGITSLISLCFTLALPSYGIEDGTHEGAWRGPFIQKNILARVLILSCLSYISIDSDKLWQKCLIFCGLALSFGLTILSNSITALMVFLALLAIRLVYRALRFQDLVAIPLILTLLVSASGMAIAIFSNAERILTNFGKDLTLSGRTTIWAGLIEQIKLRPWFGYGYMGFWGDEAASSTMTKFFGTTYIPSHSHNGYLELVTSFGIVGAVLFTITFIALVRRALILIRWERTNEALWPLLFLSFLVLYNFTEPTLIEHNSIFWIVYFSLAISRFIDLEQPQSQFRGAKTTVAH